MQETKDTTRAEGSFIEVLGVALRLGLTSFGGPIAHLAYFRDEYVVRRKWLDERSYADLVALCQFLPGPASSQVGVGIGIARAGLPGALAPVLFAFGVSAVGGPAEPRPRYYVRGYRSASSSSWPSGSRIQALRPKPSDLCLSGRMNATPSFSRMVQSFRRSFTSIPTWMFAGVT
jgi:hypothetical protein